MTELTIKYWAEINSSNEIIGVKQIRSIQPIDQVNSIEISEEQFHDIQANPNKQAMWNGSLYFIPLMVDSSNLRKAEYPDIGDQLDSIIKGMEQLFEGKIANSDTQELFNRIREVKLKYPPGLIEVSDTR